MVEKSKPDLKILREDEADDGRKARSQRSRAQIVDALFALIDGGDMDPSAAKVAEEAGVGLRTVFRHFDDMDGLYREMAERLEAEILPVVMTPWTASTWRERVIELIERRAQIYERIMPLKIAAGLRRFSSPQLGYAYRRFLVMERAGLKGILPQGVAEDEVLLGALELLTGFQAWRRLRHDQELSADQARAVLIHSAKSLLKDIDRSD
ncbi:TetR/AcrR family transcriptional regulator [Henriciella litoralis]|uniref:TetR/AcrR family transcriptional regulator n=1 Tax=Henriciella litoralis TaxID=568102 RepID=UPI0009FE1BAE|nr:TetR/AcrR family transcriptional regulator [Henriciella litoralis]